MGMLPNWPSPQLPGLPHVVRKVPVFVNFWMRSLPLSATKTLPLPSTARPLGYWNCPSPAPAVPHALTKGHGSAGSHAGIHSQDPPKCGSLQTSPLGHDPPHVGAWE